MFGNKQRQIQDLQDERQVQQAVIDTHKKQYAEKKEQYDRVHGQWSKQAKDISDLSVALFKAKEESASRLEQNVQLEISNTALNEENTQLFEDNQDLARRLDLYEQVLKQLSIPVKLKAGK